MNDRKLGMLGGGNMAAALLRGFLTSNTLRPDQIRVSDVRPEPLRELGARFGVETTTDNGAVVAWADTIVLAVKPQIVATVLDEVARDMKSGTRLISIAAGIPISALEARLPRGMHVIRAMPNTAAMALASITALSPGTEATADDMALATSLFDAVGRSVVLDEALLDAVTGLSGSGPAYVLLVIEALSDGGVKVGLSRETALLLAAQTVYGAAKLLLETGEHPARLKDMVTSPGGTTIAGLHRLEAAGIRPALIDAVEAATRRAGELGSATRANLFATTKK